MEFTYSAYLKLLQLLAENGYSIVGYGDERPGKRAILRHDVDLDLQKAAEFAELERSAQVKSTYFVLIRSNFYNIFSPKSKSTLERIALAGHEIGLHFNETFFDQTKTTIHEAVQKDKELLETALGRSIKTVSMHRPSGQTLQADYRFEGLINSYSHEYYQKWKYVSDSRMHWREDVFDIVLSGLYDNLHILTHPFWYAETYESAHDKLKGFVDNAAAERYDEVAANFTALNEFLDREDFM